MKCNIEELTVGEVREISRLAGALAGNGSASCASINTSDTPFEIGKAFLVRTVTFILTGKVRCVRGGFVVLDECGWVADTGRFADCLKAGSVIEFEPMPDGSGFAIGSVVDFAPWNHPLLKAQK